MTYEEASQEARKLMREDGDDESLRIAVGRCIGLAPSDEERSYWKGVSHALERGRTRFRTKESR